MNGRTNGGRFGKGNPAGPETPTSSERGPCGRRCSRRSADEDVADIVAKLIEKAKDGDVVAARGVLDRALGKAL